jgi:3'(2'), 5'-bisphosphate nucleotidase
MSTETDTELATRLAVEAGHLLVQLRHEMVQRGAPSWQIMDNGDLASHRFLLDELRRARPDDAVLSEEGVEDPRRFGADRVWIVDPLDGTNEYGERGRHDWAVHVALWEHGGFGAGAVSLPALDLVFATDPAPVLPPQQRDIPRVITSRNRVGSSAYVKRRGIAQARNVCVGYGAQSSKSQGAATFDVPSQRGCTCATVSHSQIGDASDVTTRDGYRVGVLRSNRTKT